MFGKKDVRPPSISNDDSLPKRRDETERLYYAVTQDYLVPLSLTRHPQGDRETCFLSFVKQKDIARRKRSLQQQKASTS